MNALIPDPAKLELMPDAAKAGNVAAAELNSASILEMLQVHESTVTHVMEKILQFRSSSHWGINE
jgi:hypothetical protein